MTEILFFRYYLDCEFDELDAYVEKAMKTTHDTLRHRECESVHNPLIINAHILYYTNLHHFRIGSAEKFDRAPTEVSLFQGKCVNLQLGKCAEKAFVQKTV